MAEYVRMPKAHYEAACNSIRAKTGKTDLITSGVMSAEIDGITGGGGGGSVEGYATVTFMNGAEVLFSRMVLKGDDCPDPYVQNRIELPTKESTAQYTYTFNGWATADGGSADSNALKGITEDKTLYAAFAESVRMYTVTYYDDDGVTVLHTEQVAYGGSSSYVYTKGGHIFNGWTPSPTNVIGDMDCIGEWVESLEIQDSWDTIVASINDGTYARKYSVGQYKPLDLGDEGVVNMQIVAFDTDTTSDGATIATSWIAKELLATKREVNTNTNYVKFPNTTLYTWLNSELKSLMPQSVQSAIKTTKKGQTYYSSSFSESAIMIYVDIWVPTSKEVCQANSTGNYPEVTEVSPRYSAVYGDNESRKKCITGTSTPTIWWLRNDYGATTNMHIKADGTQSGTTRTNKQGVCIGFCI